MKELTLTVYLLYVLTVYSLYTYLLYLLLDERNASEDNILNILKNKLVI